MSLQWGRNIFVENSRGGIPNSLTKYAQAFLKCSLSKLSPKFVPQLLFLSSLKAKGLFNVCIEIQHFDT